MGRKKVFENAAERRAAYLEGKTRIEFVCEKATGEKLQEIAAINDVSVQSLMRSMIKFALTNHDWKTRGVLHRES